MNAAGQFEICLPPPSAAEMLREHLAAAIEAFNASTDPDERVCLHQDITRLRRRLGKDGA